MGPTSKRKSRTLRPVKTPYSDIMINNFPVISSFTKVLSLMKCISEQLMKGRSKSDPRALLRLLLLGFNHIFSGSLTPQQVAIVLLICLHNIAWDLSFHIKPDDTKFPLLLGSFVRRRQGTQLKTGLTTSDGSF